MIIPQRIVAEAAKNWPAQDNELISQKFERIIAVNREKGYQLESWQYQAVVGEKGITETIIAVFVKG